MELRRRICQPSPFELWFEFFYTVIHTEIKITVWNDSMWSLVETFYYSTISPLFINNKCRRCLSFKWLSTLVYYYIFEQDSEMSVFVYFDRNLAFTLVYTKTIQCLFIEIVYYNEQKANNLNFLVKLYLPLSITAKWIVKNAD